MPVAHRHAGLAAVVLGTVVAALVVAGVFVLRDEPTVDPDRATATSAVGERVNRDGGTIRALALGPVLTWDPQRPRATTSRSPVGRSPAR